MKDILVLGSEGSGKTLLVNRLSSYVKLKPTANGVNGPPEINTHLSHDFGIHEESIKSMATIPTIGVEMTTIELSGSKERIILREVGTSMASMWHEYFEDSLAVIFVIDGSDFGSLASAWVLLLEILSEQKLLTGKHIMITISKLDMCEDYAYDLILNTLRLEDLKESSSNLHIDFCKGSSDDYSLAEQLFKWIQRLASEYS